MALRQASQAQITHPRPSRRGTDGWEEYRKLAFIILLGLIWLMPAWLQGAATSGALEGGSALTQTSWIALLAFSLLAMQRGWERVRDQIDISLILLLCWCAATLPFSAVPDVALRRYLLLLIALVATMVCVSSMEQHRSVFWIILAVTVADILSKYGYVLALPRLGLHQASGLEPHLAGLWRGQYPHKNGAGAATVVQIIALVAARRKFPLGYLLPLLALEIYFLSRSGSKTAIGLAGFSILLAIVLCRLKHGPMIGLSVLGVLLLANGATVLTLLSPDLAEMTGTVVSDITYTGRTDIWHFLLTYLADHPIMGAGFQSFWQVGPLSPAQQDGRTWLVSAANGHQGYLDLAVAIGLPGLALALLFLVVRPIIDISRIANRANPLLELYVGCWLFVLLQNVTETSFMDRANPIWIVMLAAIFGIRRLAVADMRIYRKQGVSAAMESKDVTSTGSVATHRASSAELPDRRRLGHHRATGRGF